MNTKIRFENVPDWVKDAVFYQIFPERFANGDPSNDPPNSEKWGTIPKSGSFFGGDLQGIIDHIDHLKHLGVSALYLNPIFEATTNHKYNATDYLTIDPSFGTQELFEKFISLCRRNSIRVILDGVFNHVGVNHFAFRDVVKNGAASKYAAWFNIYSFPVSSPRDPNYECWWGYGSLPKLMVQNPEVKKYLFSVVAKWTPFIDGWRLDVANEIPHEFWKEFRTTVKTINPECYIVAEIWNDASKWCGGDEFDATMNYLFRAACIDYFVSDTVPSQKFLDSVDAVRALYSPEHNFAMLNLLGSHDTERYFTLCHRSRWRMELSVLFQMTYLGVPMIYYGDEIGMEGGRDPDCRRTMIWNEKKWDKELLRFYTNLVSIRNRSAALRRGDFTRIVQAEEDDIVAFVRQYNESFAYVCINKNRSKKIIRLPINDRITGLTDAFTSEKIRVLDKNIINVEIPSRSGKIFLGSIKG